MKRLFTLLLVALSVSACFENDMPFPLVRPTLSSIEVDGALSYEFDYANSTLTLMMDETQDLTRVNIRSITFGEEITRPLSDIVGVHDLTSPLSVSLRTYQDHIWKIVAVQTIERFISVPVLLTGSRKRASGLLHNSAGSISSILFTTAGGVKTSSLLKLARQVSTSGL